LAPWGDTDKSGNELLEARNHNEKLAYQSVWAVYKFQVGGHTGDQVTADMDLDSARTEAEIKRSQARMDEEHRVRRKGPAKQHRRPVPKPGR
jgi:hypothetical protein